MCKQRVSCRVRLSLAPSEEQDLLAMDRGSCLIGFDEGDLVRRYVADPMGGISSDSGGFHFMRLSEPDTDGG